MEKASETGGISTQAVSDSFSALATARKRLAEVERDIETLNRAAAQLLALLGQADTPRGRRVSVTPRKVFAGA